MRKKKKPLTRDTRVVTRRHGHRMLQLFVVLEEVAVDVVSLVVGVVYKVVAGGAGYRCRGFVV
jgi:hypothetical protein